MCSTTESRLAMIGTAIDELAEAVRAETAAGAAGTQLAGTHAAATRAASTRAEGIRAGTPDTMAERVAGIWAMVADLDPGLARRLSQYTGQDTEQDPGPTGHDPHPTTRD